MLLRYWVLACILLGAAPAAAHDAPDRVEERRAGPYRLEIAIFDPRPSVARPVRFAVRGLPGGATLDGATVIALGVPGPETDAVPTRPTALEPSRDFRGSLEGSVPMWVQGAWELEVRVQGPAGAGAARLPVAVIASHAVPSWLAWAIGLSPLLGLAWFAWWQRGYLRTLPAEGEPGPTGG